MTEISDLETELNGLEIPVDETKTEIVENERKVEKMDIRSSSEYLHAWTNAVKTGRDDEVRAILKTENVSGGTIPVPTYVENKIMTAWNDNAIMSRIRKTYFRGNFVVPYEVSSSDAGIHVEGTDAPESETLELSKVTLVAGTIKKWVPVTDEALAMGLGGDERFIDYIFDELTYRILEAFEGMAINNITTSELTATGTVTNGAYAVITGEGLLSGRATNPVVIMNRATRSRIRIAALQNSYGFDPFDGLDVVVSEMVDNNKIIVGDLSTGYLANFPNGAVVDVVPDADPKADKIDFVGRLLVGHNVVAPGAFAYITIGNDGD